MTLNEVNEETRSRMALALDVDDLVEAGRLGRRLFPWFSVAKVGLELFAASGPEAVGNFIDQGYQVFLDLKLHDIPNTVGKTARVLGSLGVSYVTVHSSGGIDMLKAAVDGLNEGATAAGLTPPMVLGVSVLTSEKSATPEKLQERISNVVAADCGGIVCAASDLRFASYYVRTSSVVPGIRPEGVSNNDQGRPATPSTAIQEGAGLLVIGRAVTASADLEQAANAIALEVSDAL